MIDKLVQRTNMVVTGTLVAVVMCLLRLSVAHFNPTYFVTAGTDFTNSSDTPVPTIIQPGQGYDGQFFYRLAQAPYDFSTTAYGITLDHPPYRIQRIGYPALAYALSLAGQPPLVAWAMIVVNILAMGGIFYFAERVIKILNGERNGWLPVLLFGLYMSLARDLSEITELFFFTGALYYSFRGKGGLYAIFATAALFCRDTSAIALLPLSVCIALQRHSSRHVHLMWLGIPFLAFAAWRLFLFYQIPSVAESTAGYHSIGGPFKGLYNGFVLNARFDSLKNILQCFFWCAYIAWYASLAITTIRTTSVAMLRTLSPAAILQVITLVWLAFALCISDIIYCDDWGFVRIFSLWSLTALLSLSSLKKRTGTVFNLASLGLTLLTLIRLIIRV